MYLDSLKNDNSSKDKFCHEVKKFFNSFEKIFIVKSFFSINKEIIYFSCYYWTTNIIALISVDF